MEGGLQYEVMRARIEETRSRLKAKAFDALVSGEAALLGGEPESGEPSPQPAGPVDGEVEETIDTVLREDDV